MRVTVSCFVVLRLQATNVSKDALLQFHHAFMEELGNENSTFYRTHVRWPEEDSDELRWSLDTYALLGLPGCGTRCLALFGLWSLGTQVPLCPNYIVCSVVQVCCVSGRCPHPLGTGTGLCALLVRGQVGVPNPNVQRIRHPRWQDLKRFRTKPWCPERQDGCPLG